MSSPQERPGGTNEPICGEDRTRGGAMNKHFLKGQLEGAGEQAWRTGAPHLQQWNNPVEMCLPRAGVQQSAATSHSLSEAQAAEPVMPERLCTERPSSPVTSMISMKSDASREEPLNFRREETGIEGLTDKPGSPMSSVSRSDSDKSKRPNFAQESTSVLAGGVQCDVCLNPAVKACLTCRDSYCQTCIRPHYCDPDLERHQLQDLPHQGRCEQHNKKTKFYCRTDQSAICSRCLLHSHKGHDVTESDNDQSALQTQTKKKGVPPPGPIQFPSVQSKSVTLRWSLPEGAPGDYRYRVTWRRGQESRSIEVVGLEVEVGGLLPGEKYHFSVVTLGEDGHRSTCVEESIRTEVPVPKNVTVTPGPTSVSVTWAKPGGLESGLKVSYLVQLFKEEQVKSIVTDYLNFNTSDLQHGSEYTVEISTILPDSCQSKPTSKHFMTVIPAPEHLTVSSITASSAHLRWQVSPEMDQTPHRFLVSYWKEGTEQSIPTQSCSTDITGLKPGTEYSVTVCTELHHGGKSNLATLQIKTGISLSDLLQAMGLKIEEKITFSSVLEISRDIVCDRLAPCLKELPWTFLRKLMMCNLNARNACCVHDSNEFGRLNPLDLITAVLLCSDPFLQQEMVSKMAMCQFAVPLLLPNCDTQQSTLMLWAMRDIVKMYRPHSLAGDRTFVEGRIVEMDIPMVSFVRVGKSSLAKSQIVNKLLSNSHQHNDTFIHHDLECGDVARKISDGLVEISWYLPSGNPNIDKFTQPVVMANLRGDGRMFKKQMSFLCQTSAAVFIFSDDPEVLSSLANSDSKAEIYLVPNSLNINMELLRNTCRKYNFKEQNIIGKEKRSQAGILKILWSCVCITIERTSSRKVLKVSDMADIAHDVGFLTDEDCKECMNAKLNAAIITEKLTNIEEFKMDQLPLHGEMWKEISESEKEICRMKKAGKDIEHYKSKLRNQKNELRVKQSEKKISKAVFNFIAGITQESKTEHLYFLKWLKIQLDTISRCNLSNFRELYKECKQGDMNCEKIAKLEEQISRGSLGPEHFFRELGQLYECACSGSDDVNKATVEHLPGLCAQILLDGLPVELVDGDASNIPMKWISEVLTQLHEKLGSKSKILVLTVLGVQGTGKSTLLNTMFGVQFAVSSGRCTRGAFMLLIKVSEDLRPELKCDFIMVIDTEGLKSPELSALDTSYAHDNELATLVIGLSDITIVNVAMENNTEMKDILQVVVHAFLRMKEVGKKPRCVFVHQNVADLSAYINNSRDRKKLVDQLNEMTQAAAKMERRESNTKFTDVMEYDSDKDSYYIPGLWYGTPPMAAVNPGYSEAVYELKRSLISDLLNYTTRRHDAIEFIEWTKSLWDAVKFEDFIFNFKNSLVAEAYVQLCSEYNKWEWSIQKEVNSWIQDQETQISNFGYAGCKKLHISLLRGKLLRMKSCAQQLLNRFEEKLLKDLDEYFSKKDNYVFLVEKHKEDFKNSARFLIKETDYIIQNSLHRAVDIREGMEKVNEINNAHREIIKEQILKLLDTYKTSDIEFSDEHLDQLFEEKWRDIKYPRSLEEKDIYPEVLDLLQKNFTIKTGHSKRQLKECDLHKCGQGEFTVKSEWCLKRAKETEKEMQEICNNIIADCESIVSEKVKHEADFHCTYIKELLSRIDEKTKVHELSEECEVDLKLHICSRAYREFQAMHNHFIVTNNPQKQLELSKNKLKEEFKDLFHKRDQCQKKAKEFSEDILRPAVKDYVNRKLGLDIVEEMVKGSKGVNYSTVANFQYALLKQMLLEENYMNYNGYIGSYDAFVKRWIKTQIHQMLSKDNKLAELQKRHCSFIVNKIMDVLYAQQVDENTSFEEFLQLFRGQLEDQLIFSKGRITVILDTPKTKEFSISLLEFVKEMEESMAQNYSNESEDFYIDLLPFKPHEILFKRVIGCGQQCPFCKTPCEAGGRKHKVHFSSLHRPQGLGSCSWAADAGSKLATNICTSLVMTKVTFQSPKTDWKFVPMMKYRQFYPDWKIKGDAKDEATDYWKYVLMRFNKEFAESGCAEPADIPPEWTQLTQQHALESLKHSFKIDN